MSVEQPISRRGVLAAGAAGAGLVVLAGCGGGSYGDRKSTGSAATSGAGKAGGSDDALVTLSDIPVGQAVSATHGGEPVIVAQPTQGAAAAFSAKCTHLGCTVRPAGTELHCPCHGSRYSATTGKVLHGPAPRPLDKLDVHVANGAVLSGS